jgi:hypothetical protein
MNEWSRHLLRSLHHRRLGDSTGAIAGLASGISVLVGLVAAHFTPHGLARLAMALHLHRKPFILQLAPTIAGVAVAFATASGILKFYTWYTNREPEPPADAD